MRIPQIHHGSLRIVSRIRNPTNKMVKVIPKIKPKFFISTL
jgi:hypothetical protein